MANKLWAIGYSGWLHRAEDGTPWESPEPANQPPTASFTTSINNLAVTVNASASSDPDGTIAGYSWNWGDGTSNGSDVNASHTYASANTYTITLTVTDNDSATHQTTRSVSVSAAPDPEPGVMQQLVVSSNGRYLVHEDNTPFIYQGDTAWALMNRTTREEVDQYLDARQAQGFTVIQTVAVFPVNGPVETNPYGHKPINANVSSRNELYWQHADYVVDAIESRGMHVALFPMWMFSSVNNNLINSSNAQEYGEFIGDRYKDHKGIIWVVGGDSRQYDQAIDRAMAKGLAIGVAGTEDYSKLLMSYHPGTPQTSSTAYHNDTWLDFNMQQSSHCGAYPNATYNDYILTPAKPAIDAESIYEDHPICWNVANGYSSPKQVRAGMYASVFGGGFGFVYGNHATWQMYSSRYSAINAPLDYWYNSMQREVANDAVHIRTLLESRPILSRIPDQSFVTSGKGSTNSFIRATRNSDGAYAMVYTSMTGAFTVDLDKLSGSTAQLWWYNPRTGAANDAGQMASTGTTSVTPPDSNDWVLVVDDVAQGYSAPG